MALLKKSRKKKEPKRSKNTHVTKSGKTIKLHTSLSDRIKASRDEKALRKAERLRGMPKSRIKRFFYRLHPKRLYKYWFSREGAIMALKVTGIGLVAIFILMIGVFAYFRKDLPNLRDISGNNIGGSIRYFDRTGETLLWEDYDAVKRIPVNEDQISDYLRQATIALEDRDFFKHGGFDTRGIMRAAWANLTGGGTSQGGSTITQQLVKLSQDWTRDRSYTRKVKELILAVELERSYSKEEILTGYLNTAPYGNIQYGAEVAARDYFHKSAKDLTLAESVFLAAIPQSPSYYSPYGAFYNEELGGETGREALIGRMHYTLDVMYEMGFISKEIRDETKQIDVLATIHKPTSKYAGIRAPHFALAAKEELERQYAGLTVNRTGWKVTTTLDLNLQQIAEEEVSKGMAQVRRQRGNVAAFAATDVETGQIVAMVGGPDFNNEEYGQNNYARTPLPPGSSFKPYDYAALMENTDNVGAGTVLYDSRGPLPGYPCTNDSNCLRDFDRRYPGPVTMRYALGGSRNVPAVKAMLIAGVDNTIKLAEDMMNASNPDGYGYNCYQPGTTQFIADNEAPCYASSAIGDGAYLKLDEHIHGLATFSRLGLNIPRTYILKIEDANNRTTYEWKLEGGKQVIRPDTAYIMNDMLSDPRASYMGQKSQRMQGAGGQWKVALKTGTTNDAKDGWMTGYTSKYAAGVWVGYHNRQVEMTGGMEVMTRPIMMGWMQRVHRDMAPVDWTRPSGVQSLPAFVQRTHVGFSSQEPGPSNDLYPSWYKKKNGSNQKVVLDKISNKLATECTPELAKQEESGGSASLHSIDKFVGGGGATEEKDDVHQCTDARPGISNITATPLGSSFNLSATVTQGTHPLAGNEDKGAGKIEFLVGGQVVGSQTLTGQGTYSVSWAPTGNSDQSYTARVIDSVLYDTTSNSITLDLISLDYDEVGLNILFNWGSSGGGVYFSSGTQVCSGGGSCSRSVGDIPNGSKVYARDGNKLSPTVTVSH